ncbi:hypothetical protein CR513_48578, partial [Mucuna pruriens]
MKAYLDALVTEALLRTIINLYYNFDSKVNRSHFLDFLKQKYEGNKKVKGMQNCYTLCMSKNKRDMEREENKIEGALHAKFKLNQGRKGKKKKKTNKTLLGKETVLMKGVR